MASFEIELQMKPLKEYGSGYVRNISRQIVEQAITKRHGASWNRTYLVSGDTVYAFDEGGDLYEGKFTEATMSALGKEHYWSLRAHTSPKRKR